MKTPFVPILGFALCLLLSSCIVTSENPLSTPANAEADPKLLGDWYGKKEQNLFRFTMRKSPWMHVDIISSKPGDKMDSYDFYPTTIGNNNYLNVVITGKDDDGKPTKAYTFIRYTISHGRALQMWKISQDVTAAAVKAGKLKGTVHQDKSPMMVGTPPRPDVDVSLTGSTASLAKYVRNADVSTLFSDKMEPLYRVNPSEK